MSEWANHLYLYFHVGWKCQQLQCINLEYLPNDFFSFVPIFHFYFSHFSYESLGFQFECILKQKLKFFSIVFLTIASKNFSSKLNVEANSMCFFSIRFISTFSVFVILISSIPRYFFFCKKRNDLNTKWAEINNTPKFKIRHKPKEKKKKLKPHTHLVSVCSTQCHKHLHVFSNMAWNS